MWGYDREVVLNRPLLEGVPELEGQGFDTLIGNVLKTGVPYLGKETPAQLLRNGKLETSYYNFVFQPVYDGQGQITGVLDVVTDVSEQVRARQQVQQLNEELAATNEELNATNEELMATIEELYAAKEAIEGLNTDLEARVRERTRQVDASYQQMELANGQLQKINNDLNTFVYTASHDLKSPILSVESLLAALGKRLGPEVGQNQIVTDLFEMLSKQVNRLKATIEDLTDVARIGQESAEDVAGIGLGPVLAEVLQRLEKSGWKPALG
jgi:signal transduction histidine kinase